mgnify:CR=1 FL=1
MRETGFLHQLAAERVIHHLQLGTELVEPPEGSKVGERVVIDGLEGEPFSSSQVKKRKIWTKVSNDLKTGEGGVATWQGKTIQTSAGPCKAASLVGVPIA